MRSVVIIANFVLSALIFAAIFKFVPSVPGRMVVGDCRRPVHGGSIRSGSVCARLVSRS